MLRRCLASLRRDRDPDIAVEIIVLLNGTHPTQQGVLSAEDVRDVVILRCDTNIGFAAGCNLAAQEARGSALILLNDDVEVEAGWLRALVTTLVEEPEAGAVGSRIVLPSGLLQEAGSVIWSDGSTFGVGRGLPASGNAYRYRRIVDYCSACALLVQRDVWDALGGFDENYVLAYYEDADLCLRIKEELGRTVIYEPSAVVIHHEHASSSPETLAFLFKENRERFCEKWVDQLRERELPGPFQPARVQQAVMRARGLPARVLVVDDRVPDMRIGGGGGRMFLAIRELAASGYAVTVAPFDTHTGDPLPLGRLGIEVTHENLECHLSRPEIVYEAVIISRPNNYQNAIGSVRMHQPHAAVVYDAEALYHRRLERQAELTTEFGRATIVQNEAALARELESDIGRAVDAVVCISEEEAQWVRSNGATCRVEVVPPLDPQIDFGQRSFGEREGLLFVAGWLSGADSPNGDGLTWFAQEVLPLIEARIPWVRLRVTGVSPPESLLWLERPTLTFTRSARDLDAMHDAARVVVAPLRYGAGVKLKAVDAIARGVPVVGTSVGLEGIPYLDQETADVTDDPAEFARATIALLENRHLWERRRAALERLNLRWHGARKHWPEILDDARGRMLLASPVEVLSR